MMAKPSVQQRCEGCSFLHGKYDAKREKYLACYYENDSGESITNIKLCPKGNTSNVIFR